jgi:D-alanyl-D-alanine carboxypeptidase
MYQNNQYQRPKTKPKVLTSPKGLFVLVLVAGLLIIAAGGLLLLKNQRQPNQTANNETTPASIFDKTEHSLTDPTSLWVVVNKKRPLDPQNYSPSPLSTPNIEGAASGHQVNEQTAAALEELSNAAFGEGIELAIVSAYRSYDRQTSIYNSMVKGYGQAEADRVSARPGYSEHQTGWAADLGAASGECELETCFADTPEGRWLAANAYKHGFIIRYPEGKEHITGYDYEPWHLRFVGKELASEMHTQKVQTLEEFFGLPAAKSY